MKVATANALDMPHLASRIFGTPLAVSRAKLETILAVLTPRFSGEGSPVTMTAGPAPQRAELDVSGDGIATISVEGSLVRRGGFASLSGMSTYDSIAQDVDAAASDPRVKGVLLAIDSPGGEVAGLFDLVAKIEALGESKPVFAVADEEAYSAAYAIACAADCVYVARTGGVGSVGIVACHLDQSGSDAKKGLSYTYVHAGAKKVDGHSHAPLTPRAHGDIQDEVDRLHAIFAETVAQNRDMAVADVMATEAGVYMGQDAVDAGLADKVGTLEDAATDLRAELDARRQSMVFANQIRTAIGLKAEATDVEFLAALEGRVAELATTKALVAGHEAERVKLAEKAKGLEVSLASSLHDRAVERVDALRERGARHDEHMTQEDRADVVAALESGNDRERKLGESILSSFRARVETAEKARGAHGQTLQKPASGDKAGKPDLDLESEREQMLRNAGFDVIVKDAQGRVLLDQCSSPEGRKKREAAKSPA